MASDELSELRARVERLESEVERLRGAQQPRKTSKPVTGPPPVQRTEFEPMRPREETLPPKVADATLVDSEIKFGSQVLPRVGIALVLIGVIILVAKAIEQGWITLTVQFVGELVLCAVLIGLGLWKINLSEDFGPLLIGGGSCGLYLSFAGAHVYKDLLSGETLVLLFVLLSLANLAFSWWRSSRSFWVIGFLGGLVAAVLPLDEWNTTSALMLVAVISVPAALLAARQRWLKAQIALWFVSVPFVLYVAFEGLDRDLMSLNAGLTVLCLFSLLPVSAYVLRFVQNGFDPKGLFPVFATLATSVAVVSLGDGSGPIPDSLFVAALALASVAVTIPVWRETQGRSLQVGALVALTAVGPIPFAPLAACLTYAALSVAASGFAFASVDRLARPGVYFASGYFSLAGVSYAVAMSERVPVEGTEYLMLAALAFSLLCVTFVANRLERQDQASVSVAALVLFPIVSRAAFIAAEHPFTYKYMLMGQAIYALVLAVVSWQAKWKFPANLALVFAYFLCFLYWVDFESSPQVYGFSFQLPLMLLVAAVAVFSTLGYSKEGVERAAVLTFASLLGWFAFARSLYLVLTLPSIGMEGNSAVSVAFALYGGLLIALGFMLEQKTLRIFSFVVFGVTVGKVLLIDLSEVDALIRVLVLLVLGAILIAGGYIYVKRRDAEAKSIDPAP